MVEVSVLMLVHNAAHHVERSIRTLRLVTRNVEFKLTVIDNASRPRTAKLLTDFQERGMIDVLHRSEENLFFAAGNNLAARLAPEAKYYLLLNSDVRIKRADWLRHLLDIHRRGVSAYGAVLSKPIRADGYCLLIDADLYHRYPLDENYQWWWSEARQQAHLLKANCSVQAYCCHETYLHHYRRGSGATPMKAAGMDTTAKEAALWFAGALPIRILDNFWLYSLKRVRTLARNLLCP